MALDLVKNDLSAKAEVGYEFELKLPDSDESTDAFITVRGAESKSVKAYQRLKFKEYQSRANLAKKRNKASEQDEFSIEEAEELAVEAAVGRIKDWKGIVEAGKEVPFTKENAERILTEHSWIREQVMEASNDLINFQGN